MSSPVDTSLKFIHSGLNGAPSGSGVGGMLAVLDACLVSGFGLLTATSLVVAGGVATLTFGTAHAAEVNGTVLVEGAATKVALNGEQRITGKAANTLTFATAEPDGTATGTILVRVAPLGGWTKPFTTTNVAVYKQGGDSTGQMFLRVDASGVSNARVRGYESMSDANTGAKPFPTVSQSAGGLYWMQGVSWVLAGDSRGFVLAMNHQNLGLRSVNYFGDSFSDKVADAYSCYLAGGLSDSTSVGGAPDSLGWCQTISRDVGYTPRSYTQVGGSLPVSIAADPWPQGNSMSGAGGLVYPNGPDNSLRLGRQFLLQLNHYRGFVPGLYILPQEVRAAFADLDVIPGAGELSGRKLAIIRIGGGSGSGTEGRVALDITGPWPRGG